MKRRKILKRTFAIFSIVLMLSVFALNVFAYSPPVPEDNHYTFNKDNVLSWGKFITLDKVTDNATVITSGKDGLVTYFAPEQPMQSVSYFEEPIYLEPGHTYYIIWFVFSAQSNFDPALFRVFDTGDVFGRTEFMSRYPHKVSGLELLGGGGGQAYYNRVFIPYGSETRTILGLACSYYAEMTAPIVFLPFVVQLDDNVALHEDEWGTLYFKNGATYQTTNPTYTFSQMKRLVTLQNSTVFNYQEGYNKGFDAGVSDKASYGEQQLQIGFNQGIDYQKGLYSQDITNARLEGYENGKRDGINSGGLNLSFKSLIFTVLESPFRVANKIFNFEFLEINLAGFFFSIITLIVCVRLIKHFV